MAVNAWDKYQAWLREWFDVDAGFLKTPKAGPIIGDEFQPRELPRDVMNAAIAAGGHHHICSLTGAALDQAKKVFLARLGIVESAAAAETDPEWEARKIKQKLEFIAHCKATNLTIPQEAIDFLKERGVEIP